MTTATAPAHIGAKKNKGTKVRRGIGHYLAWAFLIIILAITILPFLWMLRTSLTPNSEITGSLNNLIPDNPTLDAYRRVLGLTSLDENLAQGGAGAQINFWIYMRNSAVVSTVVAVGQTLFSAMAAYAFSRLKWPGRNIVFTFFLSALMIPSFFTAIPNFVLIKELGLLNTYAGIVLPTLLMTPFAIFFLRQFFLGIPREIEEAALLDGASRIGTFFRVIIPMAKAPITTLFVLTFITQWNDYLWPLLVGQNEKVRVLTVALGIFRSQTPQGAPDWSALMAATLLAAVPIMILFAILGKRIVNSIGFSGLK
ncbi:carbohydrate ABC transporter permease [Winkia sp. UMB3158]|uniref:carbohydrate ABC transporter permease n=1 Tax=unclassified Winkia TaxID=2692119 RepID=UPI002554985F|nr:MULTISPECIES: carbohydrate ABC transporter permease [unclassified Winkia]MDK7149172.1 carbohydrate ABC transporter permease [Winkia sp. UMB3158]MDK8341546.1 carbohydrate ABC transporter permease [Winkia sp. UMB3164B]MDK8565599.1 carbohydrate ABC transporter permease [Winkia sp. UMB3164A]